MIELASLVLGIIPGGLLVWIPVLIVIGYLLKHGTAFPNGLITITLFAIAVAVSAVYGFMDTDGMALPFRVAEILAYGAGYGFLVAGAAVLAYDSVHGIIKQARERKGLSCSAEDASAKEEKMAEGKAGKRKLRMTSFLTNLLVVVGSVALGTLMALPWGIESALDFVSKAFFLAIIMVMAADAAFKIRYEKWKLLWQYWVGLVLALGADWCFLWASKTTTWGMMALALGCVALLGIGSAVCFMVGYKPAVEKRKEEYIAEYQKALEDKGVDKATAESVAQAAKEE